MKILAAVVTHNRFKLLQRCYGSILQQTKSPNEILIVDNDSTDETHEYFKDSECTYIRQENTGSAGGWNTAIGYALDNNFDFIWLMDDDGFPDREALEELTKNFNNDFSCLSSIVISENNHEKFVFPFPKLSSNNLPSLFSLPRKYYTVRSIQRYLNNNQYHYVHLFNGALISTTAIRTIGNVDTSYYMFGDEVDFFFRLQKAGKVRSQFSSKHYHPDVSKRLLNQKKIYFYLRNSIILNKKYFDHFFIRSLLNIIAILIRVSVRNGFFSLISLFFGKLKTSFFLGIFHGITNYKSYDKFK